MITYHKKGGRTVELFLPIAGPDETEITSVVFSPVRLDHTLKWKDGVLNSMLGLMSELAGLPEETLRQLAYPDTDRVMSVFVDMLPPEIRDAIDQPGQGQPPPMPDDASLQPAWEAPEILTRPEMGGSPPESEPTSGLGVDLDG